MTNTSTEAVEPERIWSTGLSNGAIGDAWINASSENLNGSQTEYVRTDLYEALSARIAELEAASAWQPIETARPKDLEKALLLSDGDPIVGEWLDGPKQWFDQELRFADNLTHWQPLPPSPKG